MRLRDLFEEQVQFKRDNPGGEWLKNKQRTASEGHYSGITGAITGYFTDKLCLPVSFLIKLKGARGEEAFRHGGAKAEMLDTAVGGDPQNFDSKNHAILVGINHWGEGYIVEGNHRLAYAHKHGIEYIWADVRYYNGGEEAQGRLAPKVILQLNRAETS